MSRYIFSVFCSSYYQAVIVQDKIEKIQLKTILMCNIEPNTTGKYKDHSHIVNCLVDIEKITYMKYAIMGKLGKNNVLEHYPVSTSEQTFAY